MIQRMKQLLVDFWIVLAFGLAAVLLMPQANAALIGVEDLERERVKAMLERKEGCIVNLSSVFGLVGFPTQAGYSITKFGVRALTEALWHELEGTGVRAVCVHPGGIRTNIEKAGRRGRFAGDRLHFEGGGFLLGLAP